MARKLRVQLPGAIYHLSSRGDRREEVFRDDEDRHCFLRTLGDACEKTGWKVHSYCLLPNHFHLVAETPQPNLVAGMKWFLGTYTSRFNRRHSFNGHLFAGRYKSQLVQADEEFLQATCDYVHLNPARAALIPAESPIEDYPWSSARHYCQAIERPTWLQTERLLEEDTVETRAQFAARLQELRKTNRTELDRFVRSNWCIGSPEYKLHILERIDGTIRAHHFGPEIQQAAEVKARRIIDEELRRSIWTEAELLQKHKGDAAKLKIAQRLRSETTVTLQWIASRLQMGSKGYLSHLLYWQRRADRESVTPMEAKAQSRRSGGSTHGQQRAPEKLERIKSPPPTDDVIQPPSIPERHFTLPRTDPIEFDPTFD